jgi:hypothetical protein
MFSLEKRGFEDDSCDSLDDSPGTKAAHKTTISTGAAPAGMDRQESQSNWPDMQKTLGKPGFLSGEDRNRTTNEFLGKIALRTNARLEIRRAQLHLSVLKFHPEKIRLSRVAERTSIT